MGLEPEQLRKALDVFYTQPEDADKHPSEMYFESYRVLAEAARELLALKEAAPTHTDYDVALPEIEEWVNRKGAW